jgi:hypothetical protein
VNKRTGNNFTSSARHGGSPYTSNAALRRQMHGEIEPMEYEYAEPFWNPVRVGCIGIAGAIIFTLLAGCKEDRLIEGPAHEIARLVGVGCGPDKLTLYAVEESDFPECDEIDTPENLCGPGVSAADCAFRIGDGL